MKASSLSSISASFPTLQVAYDDMLSWRYKVDGRSQATGIDCIGVVLQIFRRAGLALPDPKTSSVLQFMDLWDTVADADTLFDVVQIRREQVHVGVVVRLGQVLSANEGAGVNIQRLNLLRRISGVTFHRLKPGVLP